MAIGTERGVGMKFPFVSLLAAVAVLALASCGPVYQTTYDLQPPDTPEGKICANQCVQIRQTCEQNCGFEYDRCMDREYREADRRYHDYVRERKRENKPIERSRSSFVYSYSCNDSCTDECDVRQRQCHSTCGGEIYSETVCTAFCDDAPPDIPRR